MPQQTTWENEYKRPQLVTKDEAPQKDVLRFLKFLRRKEGVELSHLRVLDLGCGTGRNANCIAELGNIVIGYDISPTAISLATSRAKKMNVDATFQVFDMGTPYPLPDAWANLILDITASNSLTEIERANYLSEAHRVLKPGGYFFVKTLCKDGDKNAKALIKQHPGKEHDTYINQDMQLVERVFTRKDFVSLYSPYFTIISLEQKTSYTRFNGRSYKRNFWLAYMKKI